MTKRAETLARQLCRPELIDLQVYESARRLGGSGEIWINANESPFNNTSTAGINRYPDCQPPALIEAYARYAKVTPEQVLTCRGADEAIELLIRTYCVSGQDSIGIFSPTYGMYAISAASHHVAVVDEPLNDDWSLPAQAASTMHACKLVFICHPNNPTGNLQSRASIEAVLMALPSSLVVVDEAYIEFSASESVVDLLEQYPNLVILRTLSKAFALAGARCGFCLADPAILAMMMRIIAPYPVPLPVALIAQAALCSEGLSQMQRQVLSLNQQRQRLCQAFTQYAGVTRMSPGHGNFILAAFSDPNAIATVLARSGIVARQYKHPRLANAIRFSVSDSSDTDTLLQALDSQLANNNNQKVNS
ncbi:histidinol-phosphate transaminase [Shewanella sp. NIFS-20-20]|uniref:histidinol-phosphate transaminase n=1 Tax=Shewanella sp. NIFS-20-20 TaxID=2853806 RepID=UPI001C456D5B|nr:histidinol-phosphate transaminase [Shewanella sp. NIFS-20-20]MBV7314401.1 histidinol-phosphate transaminase [Shewanella sp. NIFS-20-20]